MLTTVQLSKWAILTPAREAANIDNLIRTMAKVSAPLDMKITNPAEIFRINDIKPQGYVYSINSVLEKHRDLQLLFVILPNNKLETYAAVKKRLAVEVGCKYTILLNQPSPSSLAFPIQSNLMYFSTCSVVAVLRRQERDFQGSHVHRYQGRGPDEC